MRGSGLSAGDRAHCDEDQGARNGGQTDEQRHGTAGGNG
jgi:hypothetical protein